MATLPISFPGGGGGGSDEVTASKNQVLSGYTAITNDSDDEPVEGTIPLLAGKTYYATTSDQTIITAGRYISGAQVLKALTASNLSAGNIKKDVTISVNNGNADVFSAAGSYSTPSSGQTAVVAGAMLSGYSGFVNGGSEVKGSIGSKAAATYNTSKTDQTIAASQYLSGAQTIKAVTTSGISAGNIKKGAVVKVGDANSATRIANVTGTYTTVSDGQTAVVAGAMLSGYSAFANGGSEVKGSIASKAAATYNTASSDRTIDAGQYLSGAQTIKAVTTTNLTAANIKKGVTVKVGDANDDDRIASIAGTYTTISDGQTAVTAAALRSGYSGFANGGAEVKGSMANYGAQTFHATASEQKILTVGKYVDVNSTLKAVTTTNLSAGNVKKGVTVQVGDADDADRIKSIAGTYTTISDGQTALTAASLRSGYSGFANGGGEVKGSIGNLGSGTYYATTSDQTILTTGKYVNAQHTIKAVTQTNLVAANILRGKTVKINNGNADIYSVAGANTTLKVVTGSVTSSSTKYESVTLNSGGTATLYYVEVNPGITPVYAFSGNANGLVFRTNATSGEINVNGQSIGWSTHFSSSFASDKVRVYGQNASTAFTYWIFGY